ncbi:MAG: flagellar type III secretion system pore protein FliP [Verrucomicrobia bacterium]|nr:flagellar type III secretion system pore protein FliP [Verrucomicrobiota bacterium]
MIPVRKISRLLLMVLVLLGGTLHSFAQTPTTPSAPIAPSAPAAPTAPRPPSVPSIPTPLVNLQIGNGNERQNLSTAIQIVVVMTLLTLAPSLIMLMTSFTRIVIVLGFVRTALGVPSAPANQLLIGLSLFLTFFIMAPVWQDIQSQALTPYMNEQIDSNEAMDRAIAPIRTFMLRQTRPGEVDFFLDLAGMGRTAVNDLPMRVVLPAFVVSELRTAFQMGFLIFIPFLVIDFLVASTLMSMGMMMMPPTMVALPLKLLLFVLVDGWQLVIRSLVQSFAA